MRLLDVHVSVQVGPGGCIGSKRALGCLVGIPGRWVFHRGSPTRDFDKSGPGDCVPPVEGTGYPYDFEHNRYANGNTTQSRRP